MADEEFTPEELELLDEMIADLRALNRRLSNRFSAGEKNSIMEPVLIDLPPIQPIPSKIESTRVMEQKEDQIEDPVDDSLDLVKTKWAVQVTYSLNNGGLGTVTRDRLLQPFVPINQQTKCTSSNFVLGVFISNRFLDLYTKCGSLVDAQKVFDEMGKRDLCPHGVIMAGLDYIEPLLAQPDELQLLLLAPVFPRLPPKPPDVSQGTVGFAEPSHSSFNENQSIILIYRMLLQSLFSQSVNVDEYFLTRMHENSVMRHNIKPRRVDAFLSVLVSFVLCGYAVSKECTKILTQSHTFRYELLTSKNETWKQEVMSHYHLTPTDDSAWEDMPPRRFLREDHQHEWSMMYRKIKNLGVFSPLQGFLNEVPLQDVRLQVGSIHAQAQNTNVEYLLMLDVDRLIWSFRKTAGLPTPATPYGGWEGAEVELRDHFVGHYLSASALMWASTQNGSLKEKMSAVVAGLPDCQEKIGTRYKSAFPSEFFDRFEIVQPVRAPYYTIHKILAGLLDQHTIAGNPRALKMVISIFLIYLDVIASLISVVFSESKKSALKSIEIIGLGTGPEVEKKLKYARDVSSGIICGRELVNSPANVLTPGVLAEEAYQTASTYSDVFTAQILDVDQCKELKMGSYLAVAATSENPPHSVHLVYKPPSGPVNVKLALVGKGLTFDSGGYNIKTGPGYSIERMKQLMGGSAAFFGAAKTLGQMKPLGVEVHFIVAACENMISGTGMRPGDIVTASNGKTINNTDAGCIILLLQDDQVSCLEFFKEGKWVEIPPSKNNAIFVNIGDQIEVLSNRLYKSIVHRVMPVKNGIRLSIATFYNPSGDAIIFPAPRLLYPSNFSFGDNTLDSSHHPEHNSKKALLRFFGEHNQGKLVLHIIVCVSLVSLKSYSEEKDIIGLMNGNLKDGLLVNDTLKLNDANRRHIIWMIQHQLPLSDATWEDHHESRKFFPNFNLEDKVDFYGGGNVTNAAQKGANEVHGNIVTKVGHVCGNDAIKGDHKRVRNKATSTARHEEMIKGGIVNK